MADGYLESHYAEYEKKKAEWLKKKAKYSYNYGRKDSKDASRHHSANNFRNRLRDESNLRNQQPGNG